MDGQTVFTQMNEKQILEIKLHTFLGCVETLFLVIPGDCFVPVIFTFM